MRLENQENRASVQKMDCLFSSLIPMYLTSKFLKTSFLEKWLRHNIKLKMQNTKLYTTHWKMVKLWFSLHCIFSELFKFPIINIYYLGRNNASPHPNVTWSSLVIPKYSNKIHHNHLRYLLKIQISSVQRPMQSEFPGWGWGPGSWSFNKLPGDYNLCVSRKF